MRISAKTLTILTLLFLTACAEGEENLSVDTDRQTITFTPIKNQGANETCWAYAMLATIEANRLRMGDSVHLSVGYAVRHLIEDSYRSYVLSGGATPFTTRATAQTLLNIMERHGMVPHDSYSRYDKNISTANKVETSGEQRVNTTVLANKVKRMAQKAVNMRKGPEMKADKVRQALNESLGHLPKCVMMLGAEYTPMEFARSVCAPGEYKALTSFTHHPFYADFVLEVPDNWERNTFYNLPIDSLVGIVNASLEQGYAVCWEGDISEKGFSFSRGMACITEKTDLSQEARQKDFESYKTTDDHAMCIIGIKTGGDGKRRYIIKNSWGTNNPHHGLMYMTEEYLRMKTIAVWIKSKI